MNQFKCLSFFHRIRLITSLDLITFFFIQYKIILQTLLILFFVGIILYSNSIIKKKFSFSNNIYIIPLYQL